MAKIQDIGVSKQYAELAQKTLRESDYDHVVYGVKEAVSNDCPEVVAYFIEPMYEKEFMEKYGGRGSNVTVLAVHR